MSPLIMVEHKTARKKAVVEMAALVPYDTITRTSNHVPQPGVCMQILSQTSPLQLHMLKQ